MPSHEPLPADLLKPLWRGLMNGTGHATIGLDPREARFVVEHGCTFNGERYQARYEWHGETDLDGRITVRIYRA